jgi:hypothetical protein
MFSLMVGFNCFAQTHLEYISEPTDSMALISKQDIDIINNVFTERNMLDSLCSINEELISKLELNNRVKSVVLERQVLIIKNNEMVIKELEARNENRVKYYSKELKKEKNKKTLIIILKFSYFLFILHKYH